VPRSVLVTLRMAMGVAAMAEWQILRPSEKTAETIGFVFAETEEQALAAAFRKFESRPLTSRSER
jgi:hypothetical protein